MQTSSSNEWYRSASVRYCHDDSTINVGVDLRIFIYLIWYGCCRSVISDTVGVSNWRTVASQTAVLQTTDLSVVWSTSAIVLHGARAGTEWLKRRLTNLPDCTPALLLLLLPPPAVTCTANNDDDDDHDVAITRWQYCVECPQCSIRLEARALYFLHSTRPSVPWLNSRSSLAACH